MSIAPSQGVTLHKRISAGLKQIAYRGPDQDGVWLADNKKTIFGHTRLSIIDLSENGRQPMQSKCGRYTITFNGEIYNHTSLRHKLRNEFSFNDWKGHSDSETLVNMFTYYDLDEVLHQIKGMFAFAVHDNSTGQLFICRDRIGEKPLYFAKLGTEIYFASTPTAISKMANEKLTVNKEAIHGFLGKGYLGQEKSIYNEVNKLIPGCYLIITDNLKISQKRYWSPYGIDQIMAEQLQSCDLDTLLFDVVEKMLSADVQVGAFLSGGIDSSLISAVASRIQPNLKTFSIGFSDDDYDESQYAEKVARQINSDHYTKIVTETDMLEVIPSIPSIWDEPFADSSQIPTYLVSRMASEHVKVVLSGDGGDELFAGYNRYTSGFDLWNKFARYPSFLKNLLFGISRSLGPKTVNSLGMWLPGKYKVKLLSDKLVKLERVVTSVNFDDYYENLISVSQDDVLNYIGPEKTNYISKKADNKDLIRSMMLRDQTGYLPDDILVKVDRATMSNNLEGRVPFLHPDVISFANAMPTKRKLVGGQSKYPLRQMLYKFVDKNLIERPKMGFGVPIDRWLCGELKDWASELLHRDRLHDLGIFNVEKIWEVYDLHLSGARRFHHELWSILMLVQWLTHYDVHGSEIK